MKITVVSCVDQNIFLRVFEILLQNTLEKAFKILFEKIPIIIFLNKTYLKYKILLKIHLLKNKRRIIWF